jgi:hypothetical protein
MIKVINHLVCNNKKKNIIIVNIWMAINKWDKSLKVNNWKFSGKLVPDYLLS